MIGSGGEEKGWGGGGVQGVQEVQATKPLRY